MITVLRLAFWIYFTFSAFSFCVQFDTYILAGEPGYLHCPLKSAQSNYTVSWYREGSNTPVTTNNYSRVHQRGDLLWFIPASMEDSGHYDCVVNGNSGNKLTLFVCENNDDFCLNQYMIYPQKISATSGKLVCPNIESFTNKTTTCVLQWYKADSPGLLEDKRIWKFDDFLAINNITKKDEGIYVCQATYIYMEKEYTVSRAINLTVFVVEPISPPEIIYPRNNSIEVGIGSSVVMDCNITSSIADIFVSWDVSTYKQVYYDYRLNSGEYIVGSKFVISEMKNEDYLKYVCIVHSFHFDQSSVYLTLKHPAVNIQGHLIGGLLSALFVLLALVLICKFFKVDIVLWYRESCRPLFGKEVSDGKLYDAYVLYPKNVNCTYSSDIFVLKILPEVLEKQCGYNLFILGRDDLLGQAMVSVVDETIKQSRRVIVVLVPDSSHSMQRDSFEHQIAVFSALIQDGIKCYDFTNDVPAQEHSTKDGSTGNVLAGIIQKYVLGTSLGNVAMFLNCLLSLAFLYPVNTMATLWVYCTVMLSFSYLLKSEKCTVWEKDVYVEDLKTVIMGQSLGIKCTLNSLLHLKDSNNGLNWYRSGNETPITKNLHSRVFQNGSMLWFLPATFSDVGVYECILRNSTRCYKSTVRVSVFNADRCFNEEFFYVQEIPISSNAKIVCFDMGLFREHMDNLSINWYKRCEPLHGKRFDIYKDDLTINNVIAEDNGKYLCTATFIYAGNKYNVSRSISVVVTENPERKKTEILYPRNNTIEAELGSNVFIECNVSSFKDNYIPISWKVNNTLVEALFPDRIIEGYQNDFVAEGEQFSTVSLNITELKNEDYGQWFLCHAGEVAAYISIQCPPKHFTGHLIGGLLALVFIIIVSILIYVLFKIDIVLWYRKSCLHKKVADGKIYDAYVLYPKNCTPDCFVLKVLPEVLEKQCGYHLFIFGRDDIPGKAVVSLIDETIKQSRSLIIILVPGSSSYNLLDEAPEQQIAVYNALIHDGMKVILIEMEKIKDYSNMPESIKYIKQKHGAIRWKGDLTKRRSYSASNRFWKKVRYQMPAGPRISPELPLSPLSLNAHLL
ncbi:interleukin-1 receptor type 1-like isoform X2 [Hemicordylus capensis]|nr:interleukin-1 receptor type 1-like isoform X2 [Hemicordylus capensis]XP_053165631.1 interleukin-1 receptor type 1-like isoform X2 [Hemicordylus capensis]XP_053165632.1 interleukin-1 receptor type 1-like isoform X2 [Hemicordylus capensis]XP_053165634.1 interleukin-1 receptor type 1-like isoform X2 [Hemicordylus capensis]XP_053165635.1 interleukin-1 receptor type 1-like isoform X2 [Hemicordylus capensis]